MESLSDVDDLLLLKITNFSCETGKSLAECLNEAMEIYLDCIVEPQLENYRKITTLHPALTA